MLYPTGHMGRIRVSQRYMKWGGHGPRDFDRLPMEEYAVCLV